MKPISLMTVFRGLVAGVLVAACAGGAVAKDLFDLAGTPAKMRFQALPAGGEIRITLMSTGCFHSSHHEFAFVRQGPEKQGRLQVSVISQERPWNEKRQEFEKPRNVPLGTLTLTAEEETKLDALLNFYRHLQQGGCTTQDRLEVVQVTAGAKGQVRRVEAFKDDSCSTYERKDLLTLTSLVARLDRR